MAVPLPPLNITGGPAGPSSAFGESNFNFTSGAFGTEPATNQLIGAIVPLSALAMAAFILWRVLK